MAVHDLNAIAFPTLREEQIAQLARYADAPPKRFPAGEALFRCGDRDSKLFVIESGELELIDDTGEKPKTIRVLGAGEFTGGRLSFAECAQGFPFDPRRRSLQKHVELSRPSDHEHTEYRDTSLHRGHSHGRRRSSEFDSKSWTS